MKKRCIEVVIALSCDKDRGKRRMLINGHSVEMEEEDEGVREKRNGCVNKIINIDN